MKGITGHSTSGEVRDESEGRIGPLNAKLASTVAPCMRQKFSLLYLVSIHSIPVLIPIDLREFG